jgi:Uma2 family endonuclease
MYIVLKTTPDSIVIGHGEKLVKVRGESFERSHGSPDFIVDIDSIRNWIMKDKMQPISLDEKQAIVKFLLDELSSRGWSTIAE